MEIKCRSEISLDNRLEIRNYSHAMNYRTLGDTGEMISVLGFGGARLNDPDESNRTISLAIENGINFFETGPGYGNSEVLIGDAIQSCRDKLFLSTKIGMIDESGTPLSKDKLYRSVEKSLKRLRTDRIDMFNIWNIRDPEHFIRAIKTDFFCNMQRLKSEGIAKYVGFSSHDSPHNVRLYIDSGEFDLAILSYSIIDVSYEDVIAYANRKGLGVIAMKPLYGGVIFHLGDIFENQNDDEKAIAGLQFVLSFPSITSAISGMTTPGEVLNNVLSVRNVNQKLPDIRKKIRQKYEEHYLTDLKFCSGCRYCDSCPVGIPIPKIMKFYNIHRLLERRSGVLVKYAHDQTVRIADFVHCLECGKCEEQCPERINIVERLNELKNALNSE